MNLGSICELVRGVATCSGKEILKIKLFFKARGPPKKVKGPLSM